ncbi:tape measure protein [Nocardioides sp. W3-2-3]|uniref:tape measure protein n=1 Tax=Nocardioides convexus TaxID=2712224 RepID=UPI0024185116|nr:tape measure protein [Nocardioides convexus]NHA02040.1 tape measure protein [Nocardioides convexus]
MAEEEVGLRLSLKDRRETAAGLQEVEGGLDDVGNAADNAGRKAESSGRRFAGLRGALGAVSRGVGFTVKVVGALTVAAGALGLKTAAGMEQARIGFTTMLGSGKRAQAFLASLQRFAAETPFEFPDLQTAASSLISVGVRAKNVVPIMRSLGNATAGMGTGSEGIKRATVALQQMIAAQKVSAEDLNQPARRRHPGLRPADPGAGQEPQSDREGDPGRRVSAQTLSRASSRRSGPDRGSRSSTG